MFIYYEEKSVERIYKKTNNSKANESSRKPRKSEPEPQRNAPASGNNARSDADIYTFLLLMLLMSMKNESAGGSTFTHADSGEEKDIGQTKSTSGDVAGNACPSDEKIRRGIYNFTLNIL